MALIDGDSDASLVSLTQGAQVSHIELHRPHKGNALSDRMVAEIDSAFQRCLDTGTRMIVLTGHGKHFCTGFDLSTLHEETDATLLRRFVKIEELLQKIHFSPTPTVAVAKGRCFGAGADLFTACTHRVALADASFCFPGSAFGLVLGTARLASAIGRDETRRILTSGALVTANEALSIGLATAVVDEADLIALLRRYEVDSSRLDARTVSTLLNVTDRTDADSDLAALVRSAAKPGLVDRISSYRESLRDKSKA